MNPYKHLFLEEKKEIYCFQLKNHNRVLCVKQGQCPGCGSRDYWCPLSSPLLSTTTVFVGLVSHYPGITKKENSGSDALGNL